MRSFRYKRGLVLQAASVDGRFGYGCAVDHYPKFGTLFAIFTSVFDSPLASSSLLRLLEAHAVLAFVNTAGIFRPRVGSSSVWTVAGTLSVNYPKPTLFYGSGNTVMTLQHPSGQNEVLAGPLDFAALETEMLARGFVQKVLWHPKAVAQFLFDGHPLRWSAHCRS